MYKNNKNKFCTKQLSFDLYPNMYVEESIFSTLANPLREYLNVHAGESGLSFLLLTNRTLDLMYITLGHLPDPSPEEFRTQVYLGDQYDSHWSVDSGHRDFANLLDTTE